MPEGTRQGQFGEILRLALLFGRDMSEAAPSRKQVPAKKQKKNDQTPPPISEHLTLRQRRYKKNRLLKMNQYDAAVAAGYSQSYAYGHAFKIEKAVQSGISAELDRAGMTDFVLARELCAMATVDPRRLYDTNGNMLPVSEWPDDISRSVASIETMEEFDGRGESREKIGDTRKVKFWDKGRALELAAKLKKHLNDQPATEPRDVLQIIVIRAGEQVPVLGPVIDAEPNGNGSYAVKRA